MPTASDKLREKIAWHFGGICLGPPLEYLRKHGWKEKNGILRRPPIPPKQWDCVTFLRDEWDFDYKP
jgi:hypothetical protein